ncbi:MAG: sensor histidine kinase [Anaerolineae bacterium]|nr:sensor histidine kinase [Anaerolineae bacterium]
MTDNTWEQFIDSCRRGYEQIQQELKEVDMLIQQTSSEVDRFMQSNSRAVARARQIEGSFDTAPRDDIKVAYTTLIENQQRLFTMRGQLEKLQSDQKHLTRIFDLYQTILEYAAPQDILMPKEATAEPENTPEALIINVIEAQEQERLRLSRQMHDGPAQALTNLVLQAEICERLFTRDPERARTELAELKKSVVNTFQKVKNFIFDLRPMMLDDLGLVPTIKRYVQGLSETLTDAEITLNVTGRDRRIARHKEVTIFRVIQALIHIGREQSRASLIKISMEINEEQARVMVEDNGSGFDLDPELTTSDATRLNLPTLRERVEILEGKFNFDSTPGQGLRITFMLPVEDETI